MTVLSVVASRVALAAVLAGADIPEPVAIPEGGRTLVDAAKPDAWRFSRGPGGQAAMKVVDVRGTPFRQALRITTASRPKRPWDIQVQTRLVAPIRRGDACLMTFWLRGPASADESGEAAVLAFVQQSFAPHRKVVSRRVGAGKPWRQYCLAFKSTLDLEPGASALGFFLGYWPQTVEIGGVELLNYGRTRRTIDLPGGRVTYVGRAPDAPWRREAAKRIDKHRKGDLSVRVVDADGRPVPGAAVHAAMQRHAFGFGSAVTARLLCEDSADARRYREIVAAHYNKVVFENDLKWGPWKIAKSNTHSRFRREWTDKALGWLARHAIAVRGHWLSWGSVSSGGQQQYVGKPAEHRRALFAHIREKVAAVGGRVCEWDAINHPVGWGVTYEQMHGGLDFHVDIFKLCRQVAPKGVALWINEGQILPGGGRRADYARIVRYLIDHGQAPDGVGFMGHFGQASLTPIPELYATLESYAKLVPRLQVTELDVKAGEDEQLQADYLRDVMTVCFSHPSMTGIVMWGFWEGKHWKPEAALYRKDWSAKPAAAAWLDLVKRQWWTDAQGAADANGAWRVRGFKGAYQITVEKDGRKATASAVIGDKPDTVRVALE